MHHIALDTTDSTNEAAKRLIADGTIRDTALVTARQQTAGRGTNNRAWQSPLDAGLYFSVVHLADNRDLPITTDFTVSAAIACAETLQDIFALNVRIKPVNDLMLAGGKLGGILVESLIDAGRQTALITGVGINIRRTDLDLPPDARPAAFLQDHLPPGRARTIDYSALTRDLAAAIDGWHAAVHARNTSAIKLAWNQFALDGMELPTVVHD